MQHITLTDPREIIDRWPSRKSLAGDLGINLHVVHHWHNRRSIPATRFSEILASARRRRIKLSLRELVESKRAYSDQDGLKASEIQGVQKVNTLATSGCAETPTPTEPSQSGT